MPEPAVKDIQLTHVGGGRSCQNLQSSILHSQLIQLGGACVDSNCQNLESMSIVSFFCKALVLSHVENEECCLQSNICEGNKY